MFYTVEPCKATKKYLVKYNNEGRSSIVQSVSSEVRASRICRDLNLRLKGSGARELADLSAPSRISTPKDGDDFVYIPSTCGHKSEYADISHPTTFDPEDSGRKKGASE